MKDFLRTKIVEAIKNRNEVAKGIYRVLLGEIQTQELRVNKDLSEEQIHKIIRKIMENNEEMKRLTKKESPIFEKVTEENEYLKVLLPNYLTKEEVTVELQEKLDEIKLAKHDGQATGIAMKFLKENKKLVLGEVVSAAVKEMRGDV